MAVLDPRPQSRLITDDKALAVRIDTPVLSYRTILRQQSAILSVQEKAIFLRTHARGAVLAELGIEDILPPQIACFHHLQAVFHASEIPVRIVRPE